MEHHHAINGKINYFDWAIFKFANCKRLPEGTIHPIHIHYFDISIISIINSKFHTMELKNLFGIPVALVALKITDPNIAPSSCRTCCRSSGYCPSLGSDRLVTRLCNWLLEEYYIHSIIIIIINIVVIKHQVVTIVMFLCNAYTLQYYNIHILYLFFSLAYWKNQVSMNKIVKHQRLCVDLSIKQNRIPLKQVFAKYHIKRGCWNNVQGVRKRHIVRGISPCWTNSSKRETRLSENRAPSKSTGFLNNFL